jgi:hypothetical protein
MYDDEIIAIVIVCCLFFCLCNICICVFKCHERRNIRAIVPGLSSYRQRHVPAPPQPQQTITTTLTPFSSNE